MNRTMIKITRDNDIVAVRTVNKNFRSIRFMFLKEEFERALAGEKVISQDIANFGELVVTGGKFLRITFTWLNEWEDGTVSGRRQVVLLNLSEIKEFYSSEEKEFKALDIFDREWNHRPKLVFHPCAALHNATTSKEVRKKLMKFLRYGFKWPRTATIELYGDGEYSFYWVETMRDGNRGCNGGLIFHEGECGLEDGRYQIHT